MMKKLSGIKFLQKKTIVFKTSTTISKRHCLIHTKSKKGEILHKIDSTETRKLEMKQIRENLKRNENQIIEDILGSTGYIKKIDN